MGFFPLLLVLFLVVWTMRRLRYRPTPVVHEISMRDVHGESATIGRAPNGVENTEASPLLSPNRGERATNVNSVVVLGPGGNIGVGVAEKDEKIELRDENRSD